jgi:hypothetical protein
VADRADEVGDRLYGLPLEDFTAERDAAAKALRREKDRDAAAAVARLRKPAAGPWALNAIAREQPALRDELLEAGEQLRAAQDAALSGGGAQGLRAATGRERAAVDALLDAAAKLRPGGRTLSAAALDALRRTLHAAAVDDDVRAAIAAGRLVRDAEAGGGWPFGAGGDDEPPAERPPARRKAPAKKRRAAPERDREAEQAAAARRLELERQLAAARGERTRRARELAAAERDAERLQERLERARAAHGEAHDAVARLEEQLD